MQIFPRICEIALQAADVLEKLSRQGVVEMDDFCKRITAGGLACA